MRSRYFVSVIIKGRDITGEITTDDAHCGSDRNFYLCQYRATPRKVFPIQICCCAVALTFVVLTQFIYYQ